MITVLLFFAIGTFFLFWILKPVVGDTKVEALIVVSSIFAFFGILVALLIPKDFQSVKIAEHKIKKHEKNLFVVTDKGDTVFIDGTYTIIKDTVQSISIYQKVETGNLSNLFSVQPLRNHYIIKVK